MTHYLFVVNPTAGRGRALKVWRQLEPRLRQGAQDGFFTYDVRTDGYNFAKEAWTEDTVLVAVGGDGTMHHVGKIAVQQNRRFGVIPAGTGNDFVHNVGIPTDPTEALHALLAGEVRDIDILFMNHHTVMNACGFGLDAEVVSYIESHANLKKLGRAAYALVFPPVLYRHRPFSVVLYIDGNKVEYRNVSLLTLANGKSFGGGMQIVPEALPDDGQMNICVVSNIGRLNLLRLFPLIYSGKHVKHPSVAIHSGKHVTMEFQGVAREAELDGELYGTHQTVTASLETQQLRVIVPKSLVAHRL